MGNRTIPQEVKGRERERERDRTIPEEVEGRESEDDRREDRREVVEMLDRVHAEARERLRVDLQPQHSGGGGG
jgi:hypothetical protein